MLVKMLNAYENLTSKIILLFQGNGNSCQKKKNSIPGFSLKIILLHNANHSTINQSSSQVEEI